MLPQEETYFSLLYLFQFRTQREYVLSLGSNDKRVDMKLQFSADPCLGKKQNLVGGDLSGLLFVIMSFIIYGTVVCMPLGTTLKLEG